MNAPLEKLLQPAIERAAKREKTRLREFLRRYETPREEQLAIALQSMLDAYDGVMVTLPKSSLAFGIVEGRFGRTPLMAARILADQRRGA
ncbi:MAG: hypothetical protein WAO76_07350 [Georgfuchsia sp.]